MTTILAPRDSFDVLLLVSGMYKVIYCDSRIKANTFM